MKSFSCVGNVVPQITVLTSLLIVIIELICHYEWNCDSCHVCGVNNKTILLDLLIRYIVYDVAQINMKYLLKTKFKYKSGGFFF